MSHSNSSQTNGDVNNQDVPDLSFFSNLTHENACSMAKLFLKLIENELPTVFTDIIQAPPTDLNETDLNDAVPVPIVSDGSHAGASQEDLTRIAMQFAESHATSLAVLFRKLGLHNWACFCNRLTISYCARIGTESLRAFFQKRTEDMTELVEFEYEEMIREGVSFEDRIIEVDDSPMESRITNEDFRNILVTMVTEDVPRVMYAAWLGAAKNIAEIICSWNGTHRAATVAAARQFCKQGTHHDIHGYDFFHDLPVSNNSTAPLFSGAQARYSMALALRNVMPLTEPFTQLGLPNTFFGIFNRVRGSDGFLQLRLLEVSPTHTTNLVSSVIILVLKSCYLRRGTLGNMSDRKMKQLKNIYQDNNSMFTGVVNCNQANVPSSMQQLARVNLLNILQTDAF